MMLNMADIDELVLQLGHAVPTEATFGAVEIQRVHGVIDHPIAELPVLEHLRMRVRLTRDAVALAAMLFPQPKRSFIVLKIHMCKEQSVIVKEAFRTGVSAFVVKNCTASDLVLAVRTVLAGGTYVSPEVQERHDSNPSEKLSEPQIDVLRLVAQGCSAKQIAFKLGISARTAEFHKAGIMEKLDIHTIAQLTRYAIEHGIGS